MPARLNIDNSQLRELYVNQKLPPQEIAVIIGCAEGTIHNHLRMEHITKRTPSESQKLRKGKCKYNWSDIVNLYTVDKLSAYTIAAMKGCSPSTVHRALRRANIKIRTAGEAANLAFIEGRRVPPEYDRARRYINTQGYVKVYLPDHPMADKQGYIAEHRLVMANHIGRPLSKSEKVHHKGTKYPLGSRENKSDNRLENLLMATKNSHKMIEDFCQSCEASKQMRLLHWQIKKLQLQVRDLESQMQGKFSV